MRTRRATCANRRATSEPFDKQPDAGGWSAGAATARGNPTITTNRFAQTTPQEAWDGSVTQSVEQHYREDDDYAPTPEAEMANYVAYYRKQGDFFEPPLTDDEAETLADLLARYVHMERAATAAEAEA